MKLHYPLGPAPAGIDVLWRVEAKRYSIVIDPDAEIYGVTDPILEASWYRVEKRTPKGAWIGSQFVLLTARKRYALNTLEEAVESFKARKNAQIRILNARLKRAQDDLALTKTE